MKITRTISLAALLVVAFCCGIEISAKAPEQGVDESNRRKAEYIYMEAQRHNALDKQDSYYELLNRAYSLDTTATDVGFYLGYYKLAMSNGDSTLFHRGYNMMSKHFEKSPEDFYATYLYGNINERIGKKRKALTAWAKLDSLYPEKPEMGFKYAEALCATKDSSLTRKALDIYSRIEVAEGKSATISNRKVRAYFNLNDTAAIINELHSLIASSPRSAEYNVFAADVYSIFNLPDSALYYYNRACEMDSTNGLAYYSRANFYKVQGDSITYDREVFHALKMESLDLESKLNLLTNYIRALYEDPDQQPRIQELFDVLMEQHPHEVDIHDLYCSYLVAIEDFEAAAEQAGYALDINPTEESRWRALMSLYVQTKNYDKAAEVGTDALRYHPRNAMITYLIGVDYNLAEKPDSSLYYLNKALAVTDSTDFEMISSVLCSIGDVHYQMSETDGAFIYYDKALAVNPDNLLALNNFAYYIACEGKDLERAERMSAITIKAEPENDTSLDTYAWVLFKMKQYDRAQYYIEEAFKYSDEPSAELYHHAGDIYFMTGDPDKAVEYWQQALDLEPDNEMLQRKVKHETYFYK